MAFLYRSTTRLTTSLPRSLHHTLPTPSTRAPASLIARASLERTVTASYSYRGYSGSSYGGGDGDPKGENPQEQGASQSSHLEHPGPAAPDVGQPSSTASKGSKSSNQSESASKTSKSTSEGSGSKEDGGQALSGKSDAANRGPKDGARPKILDEAPPENPGEDVQQHNKDFDKRHDRAENKINPDGKDDVGKGFWSGQGGADRQP